MNLRAHELRTISMHISLVNYNIVIVCLQMLHIFLHRYEYEFRSKLKALFNISIERFCAAEWELN